MEKYKWLYRVLLVGSPNFHSDEYNNVIKQYNRYNSEFRIRKIKLLSKYNDTFVIYLYGLDGELKKVYNKLNIKKIFEDIDSMPMGKFGI